MNSRSLLLMGDAAMALVAAQRVIVFGTGGVGSWCCEALVRSGVRRITIVDSDCVAPSNINRQLIATHSTVGRPKVEVLRERLLDINPDAEVEAIVGIWSCEKASEYHLDDYDVIVDAIDSLQEKADLIRHATRTARRSTIFVSAMGAARKLDPTRLQVSEFWKVKGCPLARALREKFKRQKYGPARKFKCVWSDEVLPNQGSPASSSALTSPPRSPRLEGRMSGGSVCAEVTDTWAGKKAVTNGSMVHVTATAGMMLAGEILMQLYKRAETSPSPSEGGALLCAEEDGRRLHLTQSTEFTARWNKFRGVYIEADVAGGPTPAALWDEIVAETAAMRQRLTTETLKDEPGIAATRAAYKACGKDPSRYRPASEQLVRRVLQGKDLYSVDALVDLGNLVSIASGYPTGLLDADRIAGDTVTLGVGREGEPYEGIGRGALNIAGLPVYRDAAGPIASPTSDSTRTMLSAGTRRLLFIINGYDGDEVRIEAATQRALDLLKRYAQSKNERVTRF